MVDPLEIQRSKKEDFGTESPSRLSTEVGPLVARVPPGTVGQADEGQQSIHGSRYCTLLRKVELLEELARLVEIQEQLVEKGQLDDLLALLGAKDQLLRELEELEKPTTIAAPFPEPIAAHSEEINGPLVQQLVGRSRELLQDILRREQRCEAVMAARQRHIHEALLALADAGRAREAYQATNIAQHEQGHWVSEA